MVSEDSQHLGWLSVVHGLSDLRDLDDPRHRKMPSEIHQTHYPSELLEVVSLCSSQWVLLEERNDHVPQVSEPGDVVAVQMFAMVVLAAVDVHLAAAEERDHLLQNIATRRSLNDCKRRLHLPAEGHRAVPEDGDAEAAFPINESHQPSDGGEPFLLVFRTPCVVTAIHAVTLKPGYDIYDE